MCSRFLPLVLVVASMVPRLTIAADLVDEFSSISKRIPFLNPGSAIYHVPSTGEFHNHLPLSPDERKALDSIYHLSNAASASEIAVALKHDDPKIRAMAVVALARTTEPYEFIPRLMSLVGDHGKTFPLLDLGSLPSNLFSNDTDAREVMRWIDQTVGGFAMAIVSEYMRLAGDHYEFEHEEETTATADADFLNLYNQYWEKRKGRRHCLSWTWVKLTRAWHLAGVPDDKSDRAIAFRSVKDEINNLPTPEREWYLIYLVEKLPNQFQDSLATRAERLAALKRLGRKKVMTFLRREKISDDPDLVLNSLDTMQATSYIQVVEFVLANASQVLGKEDVAELLDIGRRRDGDAMIRAFFTTTPSWWIAAADLDPGRSGVILREARARFTDGKYRHDQNARRAIELALWRHHGDDAVEEFTDWFFTENPSSHTVWDGRHWIGMRLVQPEYRSLFIAILNDKRLDTLDWVTTIQLINAANHYVAPPLIVPKDMAEWQHPNGDLHHVRRGIDVENAAQVQLPHWRSKLHAARKKLQEKE